MRKLHTAPMLVLSEIPYGEFALEPYEAGWASEGIAFIYIREFHDAAGSLSVQAQISVDGSRWINFGAALEAIKAVGGYFIKLEHFGNWIRLVGKVTGGSGDGSPAFIGDFYWVLKE